MALTCATGLAVLLAEPPPWLAGARLGLLANQASVTPALEPAWLALARRYPGQLKVIFSPQHGLFSEKQDNMVPSADGIEPVTGLPVVSLYGERLRPALEDLAQVDFVLIDLPEVGTRVYTFGATMAYTLEVAATAGKKVVILDRPNPIGGEQVEGNLLRPEMVSIVGPYPLPMRHGLTLGELALYYRQTGGLEVDLEVIKVQGWRRDHYFDATGLPWVLPSPNMPTLETAVVYPGQVLLEGTNLSEGRGTTRPFELWGAPFLEPEAVLRVLRAEVELPGVILRPTCFQPTFHKWAGEVCRGFQLHVTERRRFKPYFTTLALLAAVRRLYPERFHWRQPPYEYDYERLPFDLLTGDPALRLGLEAGEAVTALEAAWQPELTAFLEHRQDFLLYS